MCALGISSPDLPPAPCLTTLKLSEMHACVAAHDDGDRDWQYERSTRARPHVLGSQSQYWMLTGAGLDKKSEP